MGMNQKMINLLICITAHNHEEFIERCVSSVVFALNKQAVFKPTVVVVDDSSTDGTWGQMVSKCVYAPKGGTVTTTRVNFSSVEKTCNFIFDRYINGQDFFMRIDGDDYVSETMFKELASAVIKNEAKSKSSVGSKTDGPDFYYCTPVYTNGIKSRALVLPEFNYYEIFDRGDFFATGTMYKNWVYPCRGGYHEEIANSGVENWWFVLDIIEHCNATGEYVRDAMFYYRIHESNMSFNKKKIIDNGQTILSKFFIGKEYKRSEYAPFVDEVFN